MDLVSPILEVVNPWSYIEHHKSLGERMDELRIKLEALNCRKGEIERRKQTEVGTDQEVMMGVEHWLRRAQAMITEIQNVEEKFQNVRFIYRGCLSKQVQEMIVEMDKFLEDGKFPEGIAINKPPSRGMMFPTDRNAEGDQNRVKFRKNLEDKIMGYLMGDDVAMVGVCGQGGVGKTTLLKSINNKMSSLEDSKFDKVIWAPIPYPFSTVKLQDTIASAVNVNLPENVNEEVRAAKLFEIMGKVKFLLILDDAWDVFTFHNVGIPIPTADNKCKVVITSRSTQLCRQIGCSNDGLVDVETLSEEESFRLFLDTVGQDVISKSPDLEATLKGLVKGCAGLPLAIVVIARSMRGEYDISEWRNALNELRTRVGSVRGWDNEMFERLKFSYYRLKDEELQNCFLFCSLYSKSAKIEKEELMESWIDGGLIKQVKTRKEMADRGRAILNRLISDCLIEDAGEDRKHRAQVRMHDVMRDMALRVAGSRFLVKSGEKVRCITENGEWTEHLEKVSMGESWISKISPDFCPNCPKLSALLLSQNRNLRMIPESFFKGMPSLTFLNLSYTRISALPDSISDLKNLTTLLLRDIEELENVPSLAGLKALKKLDLYGAGIEVVPEGLEALVNLQYLDLRCPRLVEFPIPILKDLSRLEFFAANFPSNTDFVMEAKQIPARLNILEAFIGLFYNLEGLNNYMEFFHQVQKPTRYVLMVGEEINESEVLATHLLDMEGSKRVSIWSLDFQGKPVLLPNDLQQLEISYCDDVESLSENFLRAQSTSHTPSIFSNLKSIVVDDCSRMRKLFPSNLLKEIPNLEEIHVIDCEQMEEIIESEGEENEITVTFNLAKLRKLVLERLPKLKRICAANGVMVCDSIQTIKLSECPRLHRIPLHLPLSSPPPSLQEIKLDSRVMWDALEWVNPTTKDILHPFFKLDSDARSLDWEFDGLQEFNHFVNCFRDDNLTSYEFIVESIDDDDDHSGSKSSDDKDDESLYYEDIVGITRYWSKVVALHGVQVNVDQAVLLPNDVEWLEIKKCGGMKSLSELKTEAMNLTSCMVKQCGELECMLPSSSTCSILDGLQSLMLAELPNLQVLVRMENQAIPTQPSIFSNLKHFVVFQCPRIKKLFPSNLLKGLPNLEEVHVSDCDGMEEIIESEGEENEITVTFNLAKLRKLVLKSLPKLKRICGVNGVMVCDSIQTIDISGCPKLHRIPLHLPLSSPPPSLQEIKLDSRGMWDALEWVNPTTKDILHPFFKPDSVSRSLDWEFDGLQEFNHFVNCFRDDNLTSYEFIVESIDDNGDHSGSKSSDDKDDDDEEDSGSKSSDDQDDYDEDEYFYYEDIVEIERDWLKIVALHGVQINVDQAVLLPNDVQCLEIKKCGGMKSLCEFKTEAKNLASCVVMQCGDLECMLPSSSTCSILDNGLQSLMLYRLPNLQVLVRMDNQAIPTLPSIFSNLKHLVVYQCPRIKKLFPSELLISLRNLEKIWVDDCADMEEIIIIEGEEEGEKETITFTLPKLKQLVLWELPKLKRICSARGVMVCDSLEEIFIVDCSTLKRIPLDLPLLPDGQLSAPPLLKKIEIDSSEWWESLEWDKPAAKDILAPFLKVEESDE